MSDDRQAGCDRRALIKAAGAGGAALASSSLAAKAAGARHRHAIVGTGHRARIYQDAIWGAHKDRNELVAICDTNPGRLAFTARRAARAGAAAPRVFLAGAFDDMIGQTRPETIIVTTSDSFHDDYIVRALDAGCNVITEKPMTTTAAKAQRILDAVKRNGRHVRVAFNYRYTPPRTQVKELLMEGAIGDVLSVDFHWLLDTTHGADYFRRWHSRKEISGGLMVHKATHHFDLVNWWLSAVPETVTAVGKREFYTPQMARRLGLQSHHERCRTCPEKEKCSFFLDIAADPSLKALYLDNEVYDGYFRDRCVWRPEISIEDTMNVIVGYDTGATLSYSLNACNAWEGYQIAFNGTRGRLEHSIVEKTYVAGGDMEQGGTDAERIRTRLYPLRGAARDIVPRTGTGGHGGGDDVMLADLFGPPSPDAAGRVADERSGCNSMLIGAAANRCFETGGPVRIADMVAGLARPELPPMPTRRQPVPMPPRATRV
ncbi:Gfo/Idh/MocA family oxidoreductase [Sphingomonas parva]|uniref:Gfo/Idh/MocA family oxidoreductase n=1 Tax=Sphingomonas parva TaxID=2555898 RepID=A0A4Y8ZNN8_9SPHN|nr:Gfo/Idh/MocA family oxidoreductase [Sphingomonas parva]TFI56882.1 Gfo/Idh/MocA family oxidoreductase [Sphingomonas parva]